MAIKIAIGVPTQGDIKAKTALSLIETVRGSGYNILPIFQYGNYINDSRERIVDLALELLCSHVFFVDSDMVFKPDTLERLLAHDKDVVGADYNYRTEPPTTTTKYFNDKPKELAKVAGLGTGCLLIKTSVFSKIDKPYFPIELDKEGKLEVTEDIGFCEKVRSKGINVWVDPTILIKHLGDYEY